MAVEGIDISLGEVSKTAGAIRTINQTLSTRLQEIKKEMDNLQSSWQSDAGTTIRDKFNSLAPRFEEYKSVIESYAKFLDDTVTRYETNETSINSNASAFK